MTEEQKRIERAIELACRYGGTDEMHHLQWVVDQDFADNGPRGCRL